MGIRFFAFILLMAYTISENAAEPPHIPDAQQIKKLCTSVITFPFSSLYLSYADGNAFNHTVIARDNAAKRLKDYAPISRLEVVQMDGRGSLKGFDDGMHTPLLLGSMPRDEEAIATLRRIYGLKERGRIAIHSLNLPFEIGWGGLGNVVAKNASLSLFSYPTIDECAPSLIDTLRLVKRLMHRDDQPYEIHYLHCLAGRGRSATIAAAYILSCLHKKGVDIEIDEVQKYLKRCRPQVAMSEDQINHLKEFQALLLRTPGGLQGLCNQYAQAIKKREKQCAYPAIAAVLQDYKNLYITMQCCAALLICFIISMAS